MSLAARVLEAGGIPTVIVGSALDIVEHCGVPRFVFSDLPLGNPCGNPYDAAMQRRTVEIALELLETADQPRTTRHTGHAWHGDDGWRERYMEIRPEDVAKLAAAGEARRAMRAQLRSEGRVRKE